MIPITILLAEDHTIVREGFRNMLNAEIDIRVVAEASNGRQAVALAKDLQPDVVLMDIAMPVLNGLEATRQIVGAIPKAKVLILSAHHDDAYVESAIEAGAFGFLIKQASGADVCIAIREAHKGTHLMSSLVAKRNAELNRSAPDRRGTFKARRHNLSVREMEVIQLIAEGKANKETASELGISIKTVEKHRQNLMTKLNIHDTAGLTRYAIGAGIIESNVQLTIVPE